jgi:glycosyltransferase involved in cell wall biosynthesis
MDAVHAVVVEQRAQQMKVAVVCPDDLSTLIFAKTMAGVLEQAGEIDLTTVGQVGRYAEEIEALPCRHVDVPMARFIHPLKDIRYFTSLYHLFRREKYDAVLTFTTKPNIYGVFAAYLAGVRRIGLAVRGLGRVFEPPEGQKALRLQQVVSALYRKSCCLAERVWFTSQADLEEFVRRGIVTPKKAFVTRNAVNMTDFSMGSVDPNNLARIRKELALTPGDHVVIMVARLIWSKGIREFAEAAEMLRTRFPNTLFLLVAPREDGSTGVVPESYVREMATRSRLQWLGFRKDVIDLYALADLAVLPSYYKEGGAPRALIEPMALGKPVIAADTVECRSPVEPGKNGLLVAPQDAEGLAKAIATIMEDDDKRASMGRWSLTKVAREFDDRVVVREALQGLGWLESNIG